MTKQNITKRISTSLILFLLIYAIFNYNFALVYSLIIFGVYSLLEFLNLIKKITKNFFYLLIYNFLFIFYVFIFCVLFLYFFNFYQLKIIIFSLLIGCIASDIGGFVIGKIFKGPKLTKVSPNKTISGAIGSIFFTILALSTSIYYFTNHLFLELIVISIITSIGCQIGDLFFSYIKRKAKVKDTGNILPGHGGVLDRVDGIFFGLPFGFLSTIFIF